MRIQDILLSLGKSGCLLLCYSKLAGISITDLIENFNGLLSTNIIDKECYVLDANKLMKFFNKKYTIIKTSKSKIKKNQEYISKFIKNGFGHFVICKNDKVIYNTLEHSNCVENGKEEDIVRVLCK